MLRKLEVVLLPVGLLVPVEAESRVQDLVPVSAYVPPCILVPNASPQGAARDRARGEPLLVERQADAVLVVLAAAIRLHRCGAGVALGVDRRAARAVVAEDAGGHSSGRHPDGGTVGTHKADQPELRAAVDGWPDDQLRFRAATVADNVGGVGRQPDAAAPAQLGPAADRPVRLQVAERVGCGKGFVDDTVALSALRSPGREPLRPAPRAWRVLSRLGQ